ncbi:MAG: DNRLRE domain-containing protein, partial [Deltaproteobacteria bacterium]|nr:DNRLRE domain-containing protein [Deltaproteobacteria bacterium]
MLFLGGVAGAKTLTLQQGLSGYQGCTDSWIRTWYGNTASTSHYVAPKNQGDNYGATKYLDIRYYYSDTCPKCPKIARVVIRFDVSSIPAGAIISSATLQMKVSLNLSKSSMTMAAHQITKVWDEMKVSWLKRTAAVAWTKKGGDYGTVIL